MNRPNALFFGTLVGRQRKADFPFIICAAALASMVCISCAPTMSIEEAREVVVATVDAKPFVTPPRRVSDILAILEAPAEVETQVTAKYRARIQEVPPEVASDGQLARFFARRGFAAWELGLESQALDDLRQALVYADKYGERKPRLLKILAKAERRFGHYRRAVAFLEEIEAVSASTGLYNNLVDLYLRMGDFERAKSAYERGMRECDNPKIKNLAKTRQHAASMKGIMLSVRGEWGEAEAHIRNALDILVKERPGLPKEAISYRIWLVKNLKRQERFAEAEYEARVAVTDAIAIGGQQSATTLKAMDVLSAVLLAQGRIKDAERLVRAEIRLVQMAGYSPRSKFMTNANMSLASILAIQGRFVAAAAVYDRIPRKGDGVFQGIKGGFEKKQNLAIALIKTGRSEIIEAWLTKAMEKRKPRLGSDHPLILELTALRGFAQYHRGAVDSAVEDFRAAAPALMTDGFEERGNFSRAFRLRNLLDAYIDLLYETNNTAVLRRHGIDAATDSFKVAEAVRRSSTGVALAASHARAAVRDPGLADLIRREQDARRQSDIIQELLAESLSITPEEQLPEVIEDLKLRFDTLIRARKVLTEEIRRKFPRYSDFVHPIPPAPTRVQSFLDAEEALVSVHTTSSHTYVWALNGTGEPQFSRASIGFDDMVAAINQLRAALDPSPTTVGDIPSFDLQTSHDLYNRLLAPVEDVWKEAGRLIVVVSGPMSQIPFSILTVYPYKYPKEESVLFSGYQKAPWFFRRMSLSRFPSLSSMIMVRGYPARVIGEKAFVGFGDPLFQAAAEQTLSPISKESREFSDRGDIVDFRGVRVCGTEHLDDDRVASIGLSQLNRLPDTAEEVRRIAGILEADLEKDVFLGAMASERVVKTLDLYSRRVIVFASHGLFPGDLDGLYQPAIALSSPRVTGEPEDGLLTMGEILKLRLNADWVVLSACNTGATDGTGAEAVSGLGRAFFYAGTRAILVSMWPVETSSALKLTTGIFKYQKTGEALSRAEALQQSMTDLLESRGMKDKKTGKIVSSYAHPIFWAPFIVVGEGR